MWLSRNKMAPERRNKTFRMRIRFLPLCPWPQEGTRNEMSQVEGAGTKENRNENPRQITRRAE